LQNVEPAVSKLPDDGDAIIGPESKQVRTLLELAKSTAAAKDYARAKEILERVKVEHAAAVKIGETYAASKQESEAAAQNSNLDAALADVRKLYNQLNTSPRNIPIVEELKEIDKKLNEALIAHTT